MRANQRAIESYGDVKVSTGVAKASNIELIQMLFDGLLESLAATKGHIQHGAIQENPSASPAPAALCWAFKARWILKKAATWRPTSMSFTAT